MGNNMARLTDNDRYFGPITYGRTDYNALRLVWSSQGNEDGCYAPEQWNSLTSYAFGWVAKVNMPRIVKPFLIKHTPSWDAETIARLGRDYYYEAHPCEYGFSVNEGFFQLFLGPQTHDSLTTKSWSAFIPWQQWRFHRFSLYDTDGREFWTQLERKIKGGQNRAKAWDEQHKQEQLCPKVSFKVKDFDGQELTVTTLIQEREWHFGEGWFKWLSWFRKPMIRRVLDLQFSDEVGPDKGSWKGGLMGTSIDMLPNELHEAAFKRYCEQTHRSKSGKYKIEYVGQV